MNLKYKILLASLLLIHVCFGQIPILNSAPGITNKVIYLDFDGQKVAGTQWDGGNLINALPSTKSNSDIVIIWQRVSEDFRPFDVNITTDSVRFNNAQPTKRMRVVITPTSAWHGTGGGIALIGSFIWGGTPGTPCWVFENQLGNAKSVAESCSHEIGHTLSLNHQSTYNSSCVKTAEYNQGLGSGVTSWAPIMGEGYTKNVTIWHTGKSTTGCNSIQKDHGTINPGITRPNFLSFLPDDVGNTLNTGKILNLSSISLVDSGLITQPTDLDAYQFTLCNNRNVSIAVKPWALDTTSYSGANLDIRFHLYDATNNLLLVDTNLTRLHTLAATNLTPGTYYFTIDGGGCANYSDYGSLGKYYISIKATNPPDLANTILTNSSICVGQSVTLNYSSNGNPTNWLWTISGPSPGSYSVQNPNISFPTAGIYTISLLASGGSSLSCPTTVTLDINTQPTIAVSGTSISICPGTTASIMASGATTYTWLPGSINGPTQTVSPMLPTTYTVNGSNGACSNSAAVTISVIPNFTLKATASTPTLCPGKSVTITPTGASSYTFNPGGVFTGPAVFTPGISTIYTITAAPFSCSKTVAVGITYFNSCNFTGITSQTTDTDEGIRIYPNPASGYLIVEMPSRTTRIELYSSIGKIVYSKTTSENSILINTESFSRGVYFVKVYSGDFTVDTKKIILQ